MFTIRSDAKVVNAVIIDKRTFVLTPGIILKGDFKWVDIRSFTRPFGAQPLFKYGRGGQLWLQVIKNWLQRLFFQWWA